VIFIYLKGNVLTDLKKLLKRLDVIKERREHELRVNGESNKYKELTKQYHACLWEIGKETERT
jgi:coenzyme F420-reducing hydrogenase delta subunit